MNLTVHEASIYVHRLNEALVNHRNVELVLAPTLLTLQTLNLQVDHKKFALAAQNFYWRDEGAFTGEVSAHQLRGLVKYALVGHSERRHIFNEPHREIRHKVQAALRNNIRPVLCVGETAAERADGDTSSVIHDQIVGGLTNVTAEELDRIVVAYEPVWAIGTGNNATPRDAEEVALLIRRQIAHLYGDDAAQKVAILYGGSVQADNAESYMKSPTISGVLVGGASLQLEEFSGIVEAAHASIKVKRVG